MSGGRKCFVGSLPDGTQESTLRAEFGRYGEVEDIFVKPGCETGRQWAMVTFGTAAQALSAKEGTDRILKLPGNDKPVEVMIARNQSKDGPGDRGPGGSNEGRPKKIFVGSLPDGITENTLREEFSKYGQITDLFLKTGCDSNKHWAFITFSSTEAAETAKTSTDRLLKFEGCDSTVEVMLARNQGMNGRDPIKPGSGTTVEGPSKIFVGSLPDSINETVLRAEFSKYGQILDVFLKTGCESHKQWAFIVFATNSQAQAAKDATDRILVVQGGTSTCEVMFAKFQGKNGQDPLPAGSSSGSSGGVPAPPPMSQMPQQYAWRVYQTPQGIPYYHNHATGATQWECPMELHYSAMAAQQAHAAHAQASMYGAMYSMTPPTAMYRPY
mmetsp:Transcript_18075/g.46922  ORF Transcript_18075/g.46922 Transcript_18075/m.46922 type:complete len:384 (-) Transcript_18075:21-1172(-)